jgi:glycosyltransferase involved in cell wall biosynthesis
MNITQLMLLSAFRACGVTEVTGWSFPPGTSGAREVAEFSLEDDVRVQLTYRSGSSRLKILKQVITYVFRLIRTPRMQRPDLIMVNHPRARLAVPAIIAARMWRRPMVILAHDYTPLAARTGFVYRLRARIEEAVLRKAPGVVVFSSHLGRDLRPHRPWVRITRPPAEDVMRLPYQPHERNSCIVYFAGTLGSVGGADLFLESIRYIDDPTCHFWFSGRGDLDERIRRAASKDPRIKHWGFVDRAKYCELLQRATLFVSPRPSHLLENRYNFPSKIIEYMAVGRPVISTVVSDVFEHYYECFVPLRDETPSGLAKAIRAVQDSPYKWQIELSRNARIRVGEETWESQAARILQLSEHIT